MPPEPALALVSVSKGKRRRPSGHPAKVAARRERAASRLSNSNPRERAVRRIWREAGELSSPLEAEVWASAILGTFWANRYALPAAELDDWALVYGIPVIEAVAGLGGINALIALLAIGQVDDTELGIRALELAKAQIRGAEEIPMWLPAVGEAEVCRAAVMSEDVFDDARAVFIEAAHPGGEHHAVGVVIDNNLGRMAKDVLLADSIAQVEQVVLERLRDEEPLKLEPIEPGRAAGLVHAAVAVTDMTFDPPVAEDFAGYRAMALLRADETPGYQLAADPPEFPQRERDLLRDEFLASPEGAEFDFESDEAYAVSLAIDFCSVYGDGRPLRWSPTVVEHFMAGWVPRKVVPDHQLFERLPRALDAWVRFAARKTAQPDWAIQKTREAVSEFRDEMIEAASDPRLAGPTKAFLTAARDSGVDLEDPAALETFIAGWNARSEVR